MKRVLAGREVDISHLVSIQNGKYKVVGEARRVNSSKIICFPPDCTWFCISSRFISVVESCVFHICYVRTHHLHLMNFLLDFFVSLFVGLDGTELTTESITNEAFLTSVGQIYAALGGQVGEDG